MIKTITDKDLEALALGAAILGSGGGSDPAYGKALALETIASNGNIQMISVDELSDDSLIIPVSFMGAPLVGNVKKPTGKEFANLMPFVEKHYGRKPAAILAAEIGGSNSFSPFLCANLLGCPVIDGDTIGRAFPELHMTSCAMFGISNLPTFLSSVNGDVVVIHNLNNLTLEQFARKITISFGSKAAIISDIMTGLEAKKVVIRNSYTKAIKLGKVILEARQNGIDPIKQLADKKLAHVAAFGIIEKLTRNINSGFVVGSFSIKTITGDLIDVHFKNENLLAMCNNAAIASTPDIIMPLEQLSGHPLTVEQLETGKKIALLIVDCDPQWKSQAGLLLVGPKAFGYKIDYKQYVSD